MPSNIRRLFSDGGRHVTLHRIPLMLTNLLDQRLFHWTLLIYCEFHIILSYDLWRKLFNSLLFRAETMCLRSLCSQGEILVGSDTRQKVPIRPYEKNVRIWQHRVCK